MHTHRTCLLICLNYNQNDCENTYLLNLEVSFYSNNLNQRFISLTSNSATRSDSRNSEECACFHFLGGSLGTNECGNE